MKKKIAIALLVVCLSNFSGHAQMPEKSAEPVSFKTSDSLLQKLYHSAEEKAQWNIAQFGKYKVLVEGAGYGAVWLETQPMGGYMYGKRNLETAKNNIEIFIDYQRADGRFPGMLSYENGLITAHYGWFQGYCFPGPAFELYFWLGKDREYLGQLYSSLEKFDEYLWKTRDPDNDGCLETWCEWDTGEDNCIRLSNAPHSWTLNVPPSEEQIKRMTEEELNKCCHKTTFDFNDFPVPIESMDIMSYSYTGRDVLAKISKELGNGKETYWRDKANEVRTKLKSYLWDEKRHACYDRDKDNKVMDILLHNNLRCMYFGSFDQQMADEFIRYHLMNPKEFWTPFPLPSIAANDKLFRNEPGNNWSGQPEGLTYQRSISALENYGHYAELTMLGRIFLTNLEKYNKFTQQYDPFTGEPQNSSDGYGPSILSALELVSRMYGIHLSQDKVLWSCLDDDQSYDYSQQWGDRLYRLTTQGNTVFCSVNGKEVFSFTKGMRVVSDLDGKITEAVGIDTTEKKASLTSGGKTILLTVVPNTVYRYNGKFRKLKETGFYKPETISFN